MGSAIDAPVVCALNAHVPNPKTFNWSAQKNLLLVAERGISFERIVFEIGCGNELAVLEHPNQEKYPEQKISMVQVDEYVFAAPFIESDSAGIGWISGNSVSDLLTASLALPTQM